MTETGLGLFRYKIVSKDELSDPFRLTGSWFVARSPREAFERVAHYGGWSLPGPGFATLTNWYDVVPLGPAFETFCGGWQEWVESVQRGIISPSQLYFFVPEATTEHSRRAAIPPRPLPPKRRKYSLMTRIEFRLRAIWVYRHTVLWFLGLIGVGLLVVGWIFFKPQLEAAFGSTVTFAVIAYLVWRFVFRRKF